MNGNITDLEENNYVMPCSTLAETWAECDPKIYISFVGSDACSNYMESAGKQISRFRQYSVSDMYISAKNAFSKYSQRRSIKHDLKHNNESIINSLLKMNFILVLL